MEEPGGNRPLVRSRDVQVASCRAPDGRRPVRVGRKGRILWLCPYIPAPIFGGGTRVFNLIKVLAGDWDLHLIAVADGQIVPAELESLCEVDLVSSPANVSHRRRFLQLRSLASHRPAQYWMIHLAAMQARIDRAFERGRYDLVILEHSFMGYYARPDSVPAVLDQHNVESEVLWRASKHDRSLLRRLYNSLESRRFRVDEQRICRSVDLILATSARDAAAIEGWAGAAPCRVVPNGVDTDYFSPGAVEMETRHSTHLVFTGAMHYAPNAQAILWFVAEIWPRIRQEVPNATLRVVGGDPPPQVRALGMLAGITVVESVPDVRPYLAGAQVVIAPLRIGGGTRLKILEALAMGRATVSTSVGCEGLDVEEGRHLLIADEPGEFATKVTALLCDRAQQSALGSAGRRLAEDRYDWSHIGSRAAAALDELIEVTAPASVASLSAGPPMKSPTTRPSSAHQGQC